MKNEKNFGLQWGGGGCQLRPLDVSSLDFGFCITFRSALCNVWGRRAESNESPVKILHYLLNKYLVNFTGLDCGQNETGIQS